MNTAFQIDDPYDFLTKELLEQEYVHNRLTDKQIAQKYQIGSKTTIWRRRKFFGIVNAMPSKSNTNASKNRAFNISLEDAVKWQEKGLTHKEIADELGCSRIVVFRRLQELGKTKKENHAQHKLRWHVELSDLQRRFLLGTILGDGSITSWGMFQCNHSKKQEAYIKWKMETLSSLLSPDFALYEGFSKAKDDGKLHPILYLRTMGNKYLRNIHGRFYTNKIKIFPFDFLVTSSFDAFSLAVWYMDDGCLGQGKSAILCTFGFGQNGTDSIIKFLFDRFGTNGTRYQDNSKSRNPEFSFYIHFTVEQSDLFFRLIAPYVHPSMSYKLPESFRQEAGSLLSANNVAC
jgi:hypothetical protein